MEEHIRFRLNKQRAMRLLWPSLSHHLWRRFCRRKNVSIGHPLWGHQATLWPTTI